MYCLDGLFLISNKKKLEHNKYLKSIYSCVQYTYCFNIFIEEWIMYDYIF